MCTRAWKRKSETDLERCLHRTSEGSGNPIQYGANSPMFLSWRLAPPSVSNFRFHSRRASNLTNSTISLTTSQGQAEGEQTESQRHSECLFVAAPYDLAVRHRADLWPRNADGGVARWHKVCVAAAKVPLAVGGTAVDLHPAPSGAGTALPRGTASAEI